ncbi:hypothetical protein Mal52_29970 [Symmachiella dynata]|uniref:Uncharacterized protein n=1 Tax=Symmachiella dynata TaxID=2527995 RepID=A0A517ZPV3_9PLAN|nr:hypothetical protein [Symmachiella dynata]QDU44514.1 hypothetical protein Mal52_29970 [Symmachiella dynata]
MSANKHRFEFNAATDMADVDAALLLALWGAESLHGESNVRIDAQYFLDEGRRLCIIDTSNSAGRDFSRLFHGYLCRELGKDAFTVSRVENADPAPQFAASV